ncbi:hypothetical protein H1S01_16060 [Heliobacterium chlorum]|uniref:glutamine--fructose-6-phosphate transaminase (isomerizing) n=1 Tax=Heliobacterium chlorum TaxID=2698 RepID=A0ABR7T6J1_HELCL|nr:hypothetical protein [Heliobacterium chlorum]MBC9786000.1 hypothetical protein [Heliobacterium chlorum]
MERNLEVRCDSLLPDATETSITKVSPHISAGVEALIDLIDHVLKARSGRIYNCHRQGNGLSFRIEYGGSLTELCYALEAAQVQTISLGRQLRIHKDLGTADRLNQLYSFQERIDSHGIGHARLATESRVSPDRSHPFWAYGFSDVDVHNGQLTNYCKLRRRFQHLGYRFRTDNDSELIAIYCRPLPAEGIRTVLRLRAQSI